MDASTRRRVLTIGAILAFATVAFAGGSYTFGLLSDGERTEASIRAASEFDAPPAAGEVVSFRGCGQVRLLLPEDASFSLTVTLYDPSTDTWESVTLTDADAGSPQSGLRYDSGRNRYRFVVQAHGDSTGEGDRTSAGDKILSAELDGELVENDHRCAAVERDRTGAQGEAGTREGTGASAVTTTAGNAATTTVTPSTTGETSSDATAAGDDARDSTDSETPPTVTTETAGAATRTTGTATTPTTTTTAESVDSSGDATTAEPSSVPRTTTADTEVAEKTTTLAETTTTAKTTEAKTTGEEA